MLYNKGMAKLSAKDKASLNAGADAYMKAKDAGKSDKAANKAAAKAQTKAVKAQTAQPAQSVETQQLEEVQQPENNIQDTLNQFMSNYSSALKNQYDANLANLARERANAQVSIMSNANVGGTLYSNLTGRDKVKYDTNTYLPGVQNAYNTYQTGLNEMREKAAALANTLKGYEESTADTAYNMAQYQKQIEEQIARNQAQAYSSYLTNTANANLYKDALKQNKDYKSALPGLY